MTKDSARKREAREYAAEHGVSHTEAVRRVSEQRRTTALALFLNEVIDEDGREANQKARALVKRRFPRDLIVLAQDALDGPGCVMPAPLAIWPSGRVAGQETLRGDTTVLIGFADTAEPGPWAITLRRDQFLTDPDRAVGLYIVSADRHGRFATHQSRVSTVDFRTFHDDVFIKVPVRAAAQFDDGRTSHATEFEVSEWLHTLSDAEIEALAATGWRTRLDAPTVLAAAASVDESVDGLGSYDVEQSLGYSGALAALHWDAFDRVDGSDKETSTMSEAIDHALGGQGIDDLAAEVREGGRVASLVAVVALDPSSAERWVSRHRPTLADRAQDAYDAWDEANGN